jgi:hypothetical protein
MNIAGFCAAQHITLPMMLSTEQKMIPALRPHLSMTKLEASTPHTAPALKNTISETRLSLFDA